jgi:hypothetical protein
VRIKQLSSSNKEKRKLYGKEHQEKTIEKFWANIYFTDEAHIDPSEVFQQYILREEGTRYEPENIQELPEKKGTKLHIATWINWQQKAERLEFYMKMIILSLQRDLVDHEEVDVKQKSSFSNELSAGKLICLMKLRQNQKAIQ